MTWTSKGDATCDACGRQRGCTQDRSLAIQTLRAAGWRHMAGVTLGGRPFETILCPDCVRSQKRSTRDRSVLEQDPLPLDYTKGKEVGGQGFSSR